MTRDEVDLQNLANRLKELFAAEKYNRDGKTYKPHKRFDNRKCWLETAKVVMRLKATPEDYIAAQFRYSVSTLFANTLHSEKAQKRYEQFVVMRGLPSAPEEAEEVEINSPGKAEVMNRKMGALALVRSVCGDISIENPKVKEFVLDLFSNIDELGAFLAYKNDPDVRRKFLPAVREILVQSPYLRRALEELGEDIESLLSEQ